MILLNSLFIGSVFLNGFAIGRLLKLNSIFLMLGLSFGIGIFLVFIISLLPLVFGQPIVFSVLIYLLVTITLMILPGLGYGVSRIRIKDKKNLILLVFIILNCIFVFIQSIIRPLIAWDGIASWFFGGKAFFYQKEVNEAFYNYANFDFPFFFQSILFFQSSLLDKFNETAGLMLFPFIYLSIVILYFSHLKSKSALRISLIFTFILASTQQLLRHGGYLDHGHVDILLSYFVLASTISYLNFREKKKFSAYILMQVFLLACAFIKNEGLVFAIIMQVTFTILNINFYKQHKSYLVILIITILSIILWIVFKSAYLPANYRFIGPYFTNLHLLSEGLILIISEFVNVSRWNFSWILIFLSIPLIQKSKNYKSISIVLLIVFLSYLFVYFISPVDPRTEIKGSFDRLLLHIFPSIFLISSLLIIKYVTLNDIIKK